VRLEGLGQLKNLMNPSGIEFTTFRLAEQFYPVLGFEVLTAVVMKSSIS
jgi:hypothetical protein